jgi:predicted DNA-binding transcriptional regulator AlpA
MTTRRPLATAGQVSEFLSVPQTTLRQWRYHGTGPRWIKCGSMVRYSWDDVEAWLAANHKATA